MTKTCSKCGIEKDETLFYLIKKDEIRRSNVCKACHVKRTTKDHYTSGRKYRGIGWAHRFLIDHYKRAKSL